MYYVSSSTLFTVFQFIIVPNAAMLRSAFPTTQRTECGRGEEDSSRVSIYGDDGSGGQERICLAVLIPQDDLPTSTHLMVTSFACGQQLKDYTAIMAQDSGGNFQGVHPNAYMRGNLAVVKSRRQVKFTEDVRPACLPDDQDTTIPASGYIYTIAAWRGHCELSETSVIIAHETRIESLMWATAGYTSTILPGTPYLVYNQTQQRHTLWGVAYSAIRSEWENHKFTSILAYLPYIKQLMSGDGTGWNRESTS